MKTVSLNQEIEVKNMGKIATLALAILLLFTLRKVSASEIESKELGKKLAPVEKTFIVDNETLRIRATIVTKDSVVEVVHVGKKTQQGSSKGFTNIVARVYILPYSGDLRFCTEPKRTNSLGCCPCRKGWTPARWSLSCDLSFATRRCDKSI